MRRQVHFNFPRFQTRSRGACAGGCRVVDGSGALQHGGGGGALLSLRRSGVTFHQRDHLPRAASRRVAQRRQTQVGRFAR